MAAHPSSAAFCHAPRSTSSPLSSNRRIALGGSSRSANCRVASRSISCSSVSSTRTPPLLSRRTRNSNVRPTTPSREEATLTLTEIEGLDPRVEALGYRLFDADNHYYEADDAFIRYQ